MSEHELERLLAEESIIVVGTTGRDGRPHLTALWYVVRDGEPWIFTYARSQKARNLERVPQATLLVESGSEYGELRGMMLYADAVIHRDLELVREVGEQLLARYADRGRHGAAGLDPATQEAVRSRTTKRVAVRFRPTRAVSWDHAKLGGTY
jgi:PPOX class probable F420-dependent enzyme